MTEFIIWFLVFYIWGALGVTIGYHRLLSHRAFSCVKAVEYFFVLGGYLSFEGSPIWWTTIHRAHHRYVDTPLDPHSPKFGLHNAHFGWLMKKGYADHVDPKAHCKDLLKDPIYSFLEQGGDWNRAHVIAFGIGIGFRILLLATVGWVPALASLLGGLAVLQIPLMLNVICHIPSFGYRTYAPNDDSVNVWWVAVLAMGEGWHNNHHASPASAKTGMKPWEIDVSWLLIKAMKHIGLVQRANVYTHEELLRHAARTAHDTALLPGPKQNSTSTRPTVEPVAGSKSNIVHPTWAGRGSTAEKPKFHNAR
jgi:fatty-acid desaturase